MSIKLSNTRQGIEAYKAIYDGEVMSAHKNKQVRQARHISLAPLSWLDQGIQRVCVPRWEALLLCVDYALYS